MLHDPAIRVMNLKQVEALTRIFPDPSQLMLPQGALDLEQHSFHRH